MTNVQQHRTRPALFTAPTRHRLARLTKWQPGTRTVPIESLLMGGQNGLSAQQFAEVLADPLWPSQRVVDGPHAQLLRQSRLGTLTASDVVHSPYGRMASASIRHTGEFFEATDAHGVAVHARMFADRGAGVPTPVVTGSHHSAPGMPVLVVAIADSDCYQVIDGHHRIALLAAAGQTEVEVRVRRGSVRTPLQDILRRMSWLDGGRELYQPVEAPELEARWPVVRRCTDRFEAMQSFLASRPDLADLHTYLDVASCYGWFVAHMERAGFAAEGIERDPLGATVGRLAYGLDPDRIRVGDAVAQLEGTSERWDVVSCFSLLHHFVLGRGSCDEVELARLLDRATGRVLFLDTGQEHERWFRTSLRGWNPRRIADFLSTHTTFDEIVDLGPDQDAVAPYEDNYGRHLFACVRAEPR